MNKTQKTSIFYFTPREKKDLIISWLTLSIAIAAVAPLLFGKGNVLQTLPLALVAIGTGFILHELAHREAAKSYGFHSEFRAWYPGLLFAVVLAVITQGAFVFAAPGATYFYGENVSRKQNGIISAAGPIINIVLGTTLALVSLLIQDTFISGLLFTVAIVNYWFAFFNLIPIYPLDGSKVVSWNAGVWLILIIISAVPSAIFIFGL